MNANNTFLNFRYQDEISEQDIINKKSDYYLSNKQRLPVSLKKEFKIAFKQLKSMAKLQIGSEKLASEALKFNKWKWTKEGFSIIPLGILALFHMKNKPQWNLPKAKEYALDQTLYTALESHKMEKARREIELNLQHQQNKEEKAEDVVIDIAQIEETPQEERIENSEEIEDVLGEETADPVNIENPIKQPETEEIVETTKEKKLVPEKEKTKPSHQTKKKNRFSFFRSIWNFFSKIFSFIFTRNTTKLTNKKIGENS